MWETNTRNWARFNRKHQAGHPTTKQFVLHLLNDLHRVCSETSSIPYVAGHLLSSRRRFGRWTTFDRHAALARLSMARLDVAGRRRARVLIKILLPWDASNKLNTGPLPASRTRFNIYLNESVLYVHTISKRKKEREKERKKGCS